MILDCVHVEIINGKMNETREEKKEKLFRPGQKKKQKEIKPPETK